MTDFLKVLMSSLIKYVKEYFQAIDKTYVIDTSVENVIKHIQSLPYSIVFWSAESLELKRFRFNEFEVNTYNFPWTKGTSSRLHGIITDSEGRTTIKAKLRGSCGSVIGLVLFLTIGVVFLAKWISEQKAYAIEVVFFMLILPASAMWLKKYSVSIIDKRFKVYLSRKFSIKEL